MEKSRTKHKKIIIIILFIVLILIILGLVSYIIFNRDKYSDDLKETQDLIKEKDKELKETKSDLKIAQKIMQTENERRSKAVGNEININSRLIRNLYKMVSIASESSCSGNWMYNYLNDWNQEFNINTSPTLEKMSIVGHNLVVKPNEVSCSDKGYESIPETIKLTDAGKSTFNSSCKENKKTATYSKEYVENIFHDLFGDNAKLDLSIPILVNHTNAYKYIKELDKYVHYVFPGGGTCSKPNEYKLKKATKNDYVVQLYEEEIKYNYDKDNKESTTVTNYVYTFELSGDGMYTFISRSKEA